VAVRPAGVLGAGMGAVAAPHRSAGWPAAPAHVLPWLCKCSSWAQVSVGCGGVMDLECWARGVWTAWQTGWAHVASSPQAWFRWHHQQLRPCQWPPSWSCSSHWALPGWIYRIQRRQSPPLWAYWLCQWAWWCCCSVPAILPAWVWPAAVAVAAAPLAWAVAAAAPLERAR